MKNTIRIESALGLECGKVERDLQPGSGLMRVLSNAGLKSADDTTVIGHTTLVPGAVRLKRRMLWFGRNNHAPHRRMPADTSQEIVRAKQRRARGNVSFPV